MTQRVYMSRGFTLIELVITVVVIGVLTAIAIPSYTAYILRSNRADARNQLMQAAQWMERFRTERGAYTGAALPVSLQCAPSNATGAGTCRNYNVTVNIPNGAAFTVSAAPVGAGPMNTDICATITLDNTGLRTQGGGTADICWNR